MRRLSFARTVTLCILAAIPVGVPAAEPTPETSARPRRNRVFVKVFVPGPNQEQHHGGPVVESWIADQLKQQANSPYAAVTDWVPVGDALPLVDAARGNDVWDGILDGKHASCPIHGDITRQKDGGLSVRVGGWAEREGGEMKLTLPDEPGSREVVPLQLRSHSPTLRPVNGPILYVAVLIAPPHKEVVWFEGYEEKAEPGVGADSR